MLIYNSSFLSEHWEVLIIFPPKGFLFFQGLYQDRKILLCYLLPCYPCSVLSITQNTHFLDFLPLLTQLSLAMVSANSFRALFKDALKSL